MGEMADEKKRDASSDTSAIPVEEEENELDPAALKKAFRFASYSSLALVRSWFLSSALSF